MQQDRAPTSITPFVVEVDSAEFKIISCWQFADAYIGRLLRHDIPQRVQFSRGKVWVYRNPANELVGFATFDICDDCRQYSKTTFHQYVPLLAVNPSAEGRGYGTAIVRHLIDEAAILSRQTAGLYDVLFLDVYESNTKAINLYRKCGFTVITSEPLVDPLEYDKPYIIMAKRVSGPPPSMPA